MGRGTRRVFGSRRARASSGPVLGPPIRPASGTVATRDPHCDCDSLDRPLMSVSKPRARLIPVHRGSTQQRQKGGKGRGVQPTRMMSTTTTSSVFQKSVSRPGCGKLTPLRVRVRTTGAASPADSRVARSAVQRAGRRREVRAALVR